MSLPAKIQIPEFPCSPRCSSSNRLGSTTCWRPVRCRRPGGYSLAPAAAYGPSKSGFRFRTRGFPSRRARARES